VRLVPAGKAVVDNKQEAFFVQPASCKTAPQPPALKITGMATANQALDRFVLRVRELYSLPAVALKVLELTNQPQVDVRVVKACIENDPALSAKILRVVNSSLFGLSREARDLNQALAHLGTKPLKLLVLGFSLSETLCTHSQGKATDRYWRHTLTQAVAARELSERIWRLPGDEAFLAALLQNVGMLVLLQELGEPYARFLNRAFAASHDVAELEAGSLGFDHAELSVRLLELWHLPDSMVAAIQAATRADGEDGLPPTDRAFVRILRVARLMADLVVDRQHSVLERLFHEPAAAGPLTRGQIDDLVSTLETKVEQLADVFAFELPAVGTDYRDVLVEAHTQLSRLTSEMAGDLLSRARGVEIAAEESKLLADAQELSAALAKVCSPREPAGRGRPRVEPAPPEPTPVVPAEGPNLLLEVSQRLGSLGTLANRLVAALAECRQSHAALSLLLIEVDRFPAVNHSAGPIIVEQVLHDVLRLCRACDLPGASCAPLGPACLGLVLPGCDRGEAVEQADNLLAGFRMSGRPETQDLELTISIGVATAASPPKNFRVDDLIESAKRCLSAAHHAGGDTLKSIGIY
jgi:HD-like signal output (HDOD) protein/GGDEF domain-containing protein